LGQTTQAGTAARRDDARPVRWNALLSGDVGIGSSEVLCRICLRKPDDRKSDRASPKHATEVALAHGVLKEKRAARCDVARLPIASFEVHFPLEDENPHSDG
jgi:hypothetical protein